MKITVLRKMRYENTFIYVMQFETEFQYLFAWYGDIYQNHLTMKPNWWRKIMWKLGRRVVPYTAEELEEGEKVILSGALSTIDKIKEDGRHTRQAKEKGTESTGKFREKLWQEPVSPASGKRLTALTDFITDA